MRNKKEFLDVDFIGGLGSLTKEDELRLSEYFKNKKEAQLKISTVRKKTKTKSEEV